MTIKLPVTVDRLYQVDRWRYEVCDGDYAMLATSDSEAHAAHIAHVLWRLKMKRLMLGLLLCGCTPDVVPAPMNIEAEMQHGASGSTRIRLPCEMLCSVTAEIYGGNMAAFDVNGIIPAEATESYPLIGLPRLDELKSGERSRVDVVALRALEIVVLGDDPSAETRIKVACAPYRRIHQTRRPHLGGPV